ncbi:response regulator [Planctomycetales bacterium ZRK34]|nr:response regulator [Planctomycetales bacterium ZRK34]
MHGENSQLVRWIVLVDDDDLHLRLLSRQLQLVPEIINPRGPAPKVMSFSDPREAMESLPSDGLCLVLCDYEMPAGNGLEWLPKFVHAGVGPVMLMTSQGSEQIAAKAFRAGAADYMIKDEIVSDPARFGQMLHEAARRYRLEVINRQLKSQLKQMTRDLAQRNHRLVELSETAHRFVDDVAHDFRTPLTIVQEYASIIDEGLQGPVTEEQHRDLQVILAAASEMTYMVEDFLDSSRLRIQSVRMDRCAVDVASIIDSAEEMIRVQAQSQNVSVQTKVHEHVPNIYADAGKARRVLVNLAVNAIKVSPAGTTLRIEAHKRPDGDVEIEVIDQGPGLDADQQKRIFNRFEQVDVVTAHSSKGVGLGLSIATQLARLNFGRLGLQSESGRGSTFSFTLPANDPKRIVCGYLHSILPMGLEGAAAAIRITAGKNWEPGELRSWLASVSPAVDLIVEQDAARSVIMLGIWAEPAERVNQIQQAAAHRAKHRRRPADPIDVELIDQWPGQAAIAKLARVLCECLERNTCETMHSIG